MLNALKTTVAAAAIVVSAVGCATAEQAKLNDLEIAHTAYTAGNLDIRYAHMALAVSENPAVLDFARTMIRDHTAVNEAAVALIGKLKVTPQDNPLSQALVKGAADKRAAFGKLAGRAFDCAYATNELAYHQVVNQTVVGTFIPQTTVPELKHLLEDALVTFKAHERHAEVMVKGLKCGT